MLLLKARSSSSDVLHDITSKVQVASNILVSWDINLGTKCTNIHCSWPVCESRWYQCFLETTFHGYTRHLPSWEFYTFNMNLKLLYTKYSRKTLFVCWVLDPFWPGSFKSFAALENLTNTCLQMMLFPGIEEWLFIKRVCKFSKWLIGVDGESAGQFMKGCL